MKMLATQSCLTHCDPMECSPPDSSVHGILQARIVEWVAISFSRGSSWPKVWTHASCGTDRFFTVWATRKALKVYQCKIKYKFKTHIFYIYFKTKTYRTFELGNKWRRFNFLQNLSCILQSPLLLSIQYPWPFYLWKW